MRIPDDDDSKKKDISQELERLRAEHERLMLRWEERERQQYEHQLGRERQQYKHQRRMRILLFLLVSVPIAFGVAGFFIFGENWLFRPALLVPVVVLGTLVFVYLPKNMREIKGKSRAPEKAAEKRTCNGLRRYLESIRLAATKSKYLTRGHCSPKRRKVSLKTRS